MFDSYIAYNARSRPAAPAVLTLRGSVKFAAFDAAISRAVAELRGVSVAAGEAVSVAVANPYLQWVLVMALARRGIATASSGDLATPQRIGDGSDRPDAVTLMLDGAAIGRILDDAAPPAGDVQRARPTGSAPGRILQSSGTTGEQKRVAMSWDLIDAGIRNAFVAYGAPEGPWLASTGMSTLMGMIMTLACWASGNPAILGLGGEVRAEHLALLQPRLIALVPDQLRRLLDDLPDGYEQRPLRIVSGGGTVPPALARRTQLRLTGDLRSVYGCAETGAVAIADLALLQDQPGAAGYVLPLVDVEILDDQGVPQPPGALGRVRIRSNRVVDGYVKDAERSVGAFDDGWFSPGDLGRFTADGLLVIDGRVDEVMNLGGHKVLPGWVEQGVLACAGVADAAAFSRPDEDGLERCWVAVVTTTAIPGDQLGAALRGQLKWLRTIELMVVDRIPRNQMGKIQRDLLRDLARAARPLR